MKDILFSVTRKDLEISWYSSPGPGGQKKNKTKNACRIRHAASGAMVTAQERRERTANQKAALYRLVEHPKFKLWWRRRVHEILNHETLEEAVDRQMAPRNIWTEVQDADGRWTLADWAMLTEAIASCSLDGETQSCES